ncbi:hypothetical protein QTO17_18160, partial [Vibrio owensii]
MVLTIKQLDTSHQEVHCCTSSTQKYSNDQDNQSQGLLCCWLTIEKVNGSFKIQTHLSEDKFGRNHSYA